VKDENRLLTAYLWERMPYWWYVKRTYRALRVTECRLPRAYKREIKKFWKRHLNIRVSTLGYQYFFVANGVEDVRYIPQDVFAKYIIRKLNRLEFAKAYADKNLYDKLFPGVNTPKTVLRNINGRFYDDLYRHLDKESAITRVIRAMGDGTLIIKPAIDSGGGNNIRVIDAGSPDFSKGTPETVVGEVLDRYSKDYIVQCFFDQHDLLQSMYPYSVNTIRVVTFERNGEIKVLATVLKMGNNSGFLDKVSMGGLSCAIRQQGELSKWAFTSDIQRPVTHHPQTDFRFEGTVIPNFSRVLTLATSLHAEIAHYFRLVSRDIALGKDGNPALIEVNLRNQGIMIPQLNCGPLFGEETLQVLEEIR